MVRIRLARFGTHKRPFYRIVVTDKRSPRDGRCIEQIGHYDPLTEPKRIQVDLARVEHWIAVGAKPTDTVSRLVRKYREAQAAAGQPA